MQNKHKESYAKSPHDQSAEHQWQIENVRAIREKKDIVSKKKSQRELESVLKQMKTHYIKFCSMQL